MRRSWFQRWDHVRLSTDPLTDTEQSTDLDQDLNDIAYIPWSVPSSHLLVTPDMLPRDNFVVSRGEIRYDLPLRSCDQNLPSPDQVRAAASLLPFTAKRHIVPFPGLGILVKFGPLQGQTSETGGVPARFTSLSEAQSLYAVYGTCTRRNYTRMLGRFDWWNKSGCVCAAQANDGSTTRVGTGSFWFLHW